MRAWDVVIIGGGIIGLSLSISLRKRGARVLIVERGEPGREASYAAAGMLVECSLETPPALQPLATASAQMYPEFVHELQDESGVDVDLRDDGTILLCPPDHAQGRAGFSTESQLPSPLSAFEPALADPQQPAIFLKERSVDPRALGAAALKAAKHRGVDISSGSAVTEVLISDGRIAGVRTEKTSYAALAVVNCAGAWAGDFGPQRFPTRPVKGQMLSVAGGPRNTPRHVIRSPEIYLVPRSDGRVLLGATVEEAGYDKRTDPAVIEQMHRAALRLIPALSGARMLEAWAGLRPGTPDDLPILGPTATPGYFVAAGHFRDGILLTPVTAHVIAQVITGSRPDYDISAFSPTRFQL
ncbi:MAG TPA: glycine oxidase ThiO [Terriglobales bacterium]|nr:glycine oxidase ThiO [Terriglobales bacterium]